MPVEKYSATQLARQHQTTASEIQRQLVDYGYIEVRSGLHFFTESGRCNGGEIRTNHPEAIEGHMVWPADILGHPQQAKLTREST